jgi:hypothetical protein
VPIHWIRFVGPDGVEFDVFGSLIDVQYKLTV